VFGPLCVAGVYANEGVIREWLDAGVRDSKDIGSDRVISDVADRIRQTPGCVASVVPIGNEAYNRLYAKLRNVNAILAWGHARVIENLLSQRKRMEPAPVRVVLDQFASSKGTVERALMAQGRQIKVVQRHKAESDLAVAAASVLARDEFVKRLKKLEKAYDCALPKGASGRVDTAIRDFLSRHGRDRLKNVSKLHFRNILKVS
jgi:ribonuclease HIII